MHVPDPVGRKSGSAVWSSGSTTTRGLGSNPSAGRRPGVVAKVVLPSPKFNQYTFAIADTTAGGKPGFLNILNAANTNFTFLGLDSQTSRGPLNTTSTGFSAVFEFGALGTYVVDITARASTAGTPYTDTETYTFHVGPIAELEVRDGGPVPLQLEPGQTAFSVVAVNNGPDDALGAKVEVTLPGGVTVVRAIPSAGTYNNGVWDVGELQTKGYYRAAGRRLEGGEDLTLILEGENAADATATATISNDNDNHPYRVVIGGTTHTGTVYDHRDDNNEAMLTARRGTGGVGPDAPTAGSRPPWSVPAAIMVEWRPVPTVNGWAVSHYQVQRSSSEWEMLEDNVACPADADNCQYVDTTAQTGQYYGYRVRAVNPQGVPGPWSRPMAIGQILTVGAPDAPVLTATPNEPYGDTQILLTWNKPIENGSAITAYTLEVSDTGRDGSWADTGASLGPDAISWTHTDLDPGKRKHYRIKATNAQGDSPWSNAVEVSTRAGDIPGAPENVRAAPDGGNAIDVSWDPPKTDGGTPITRYEVQWSADGVSGWRRAGRTADGLIWTFKHAGLRPGETRHYRVAAQNSRGLSQWSYPPYATATTLAGVPGIPRLTARAKASDIIDLTWTVPADNGSEITTYDLQWSEDGKPGGWNDLATVYGTIGNVSNTFYGDTGLGPVTTRHYRIRAVNGAGPGTWSQAANATTPVNTERGVGPPDRVRNLTLFPSDGTIDVWWEPPANDGGAPITGYSVQFRGFGSWEKVPHDSAVTFAFIFEHSNGTLLTNGRRYYVRVAAINESGHQGPYVQASTVPNIPDSPPDEPRNVVPTAGHGHIVVTWREPWYPGHPELTGYRVQYREDGSNEWLPATPISASPADRSATITGLDNGKTYQVLVWAVNRTGDSPKAGADGALKATPQQAGDGQGQPPTNPRNLWLSPGSDSNDKEKRSITATWKAPSNQGNPAFAGYQVQYRCRWCSYDEWGTWTTLTFGDEGSTFTMNDWETITGLDPAMDYQVQVKTVENGYGSGVAIAQTTTTQ